MTEPRCRAAGDCRLPFGGQAEADLAAVFRPDPTMHAKHGPAPGYEPAARKGVECRLGGSILKIAFQKKNGPAHEAVNWRRS